MGEYYPLSNFISFWDNIEKILYENRLGAPKTVLTELIKQNDDVSKWAQKHKNILFYDEPNYYIEAQNILQTFPHLVNPNATKDSADPYVIAMALDLINNPQQKLYCHNVCVITEETMNRNNKKIKIPHVCAHYKIPCFSMRYIVPNEGWTI